MTKRTQSDLALTALAVEAERRRKARGLIKYNYGDLMADTTMEERQKIVERYRKAGHRKTEDTRKFAEADDKEDVKRFREKVGLDEEHKSMAGDDDTSVVPGGAMPSER